MKLHLFKAHSIPETVPVPQHKELPPAGLKGATRAYACRCEQIHPDISPALLTVRADIISTSGAANCAIQTCRKYDQNLRL